MKIAITYDLRSEYLAEGYSAEETAEFDSSETISAVAFALESFGCEVELIGNIKSLLHALSKGKRWDLVFNIAEGLNGLGREAQVPAILEAYSIPYTFSDVVTIACTLDKAVAKRIVRDHGIHTAAFQVIYERGDLEKFSLPFPVFVKPLAEGTSKGVSADSLVTCKEQLSVRCSDLLQKYQQPALIETFLPGREFTVGIFGNANNAKVAGVMEIILHQSAEQNAYSFLNKEFYEGKISYRIADDEEAEKAAMTALQAYRALRCRDAARIDVRSDSNKIPHFIEANPIAGLHPKRSDLIILMGFLGYDFKECIYRILHAACERNAISLSNKALCA